MRHRSGLRKLNRTSSHRLAMFRNMTVSLLRHELIKTTLPKAKELRRVAEPILTLGKTPSLANRRLAFSRLRDREMVSKLFDELGPRVTGCAVVDVLNLTRREVELDAQLRPVEDRLHRGQRRSCLIVHALAAQFVACEDL